MSRLRLAPLKRGTTLFVWPGRQTAANCASASTSRRFLLLLVHDITSPPAAFCPLLGQFRCDPHLIPPLCFRLEHADKLARAPKSQRCRDAPSWLGLQREGHGLESESLRVFRHRGFWFDVGNFLEKLCFCFWPGLEGDEDDSDAITSLRKLAFHICN